MLKTNCQLPKIKMTTKSMNLMTDSLNNEMHGQLDERIETFCTNQHYGNKAIIMIT